MHDSFTIPVGAQAFTPGAIVPEKSLTANSNTIGKSDVDPSRVIPGLVTVPQQVEPELAGPKIDRTINLTADQEKPADKPEPVKFCPACGAVIDDPSEVQPTNEEKEAWLRHILGEPRFVRSYRIFNGKIEVTFRSRMAAENENIYAQLTDEVRAGVLTEFGGIMSPEYYSRMNVLALMYSLKSVTFLDKSSPLVNEYPEVSEQAYPKADDKDLRPVIIRVQEKIIGSGKLSQGLLSAIQNVHRRFESLIAVMIRHSDDPDFWSPTGIDA